VSPWLTVADVAELEACSPRTVLRWIDKGALRARTQPGGRVRIHQDWYDEMTLAGESRRMPSDNAGGPAQLSTARPVATEVESDA
jgi:excisionase family DNA binding protein